VGEQTSAPTDGGDGRGRNEGTRKEKEFKSRGDHTHPPSRRGVMKITTRKEGTGTSNAVNRTTKKGVHRFRESKTKRKEVRGKF